MNIDSETGEIIVEEHILVPRHDLHSDQYVRELPFATVYNHNRARSKDFATVNTMESMTQQSDAHDTDINVIVKKFTGGTLPVQLGQPLYGDFTEVDDYRGMVEKINAADAAFKEIPAEIRARFMNDPAKFIEFLQDENNIDEARKMGLVMPEPPPKPEPEPIPVRLTNAELPAWPTTAPAADNQVGNAPATGRPSTPSRPSSMQNPSNKSR